MNQKKEIYFTGGRGTLGTALSKIRPDIHFVDMDDFNIVYFEQIKEFFKDKKPEIIIHAAAMISPPTIEKNPIGAVEANIIGTANVVRFCLANNVRLIYISTDYVFKGDRGMYREDDAVFPVNKYAWSKLGGECAVRACDNALIVRTSFGPDVFPYEKAFTDQWTVRDSVSNFAQKLSRIIDSGARGVLHVGSDRKTVYEYAKELSPEKEIGKISVKDVDFPVPADTSLDTGMYKQLFE